MSAEEYFNKLVETFPEGKPGKMFSALCMKLPNGKAAAMFWKNFLVVKLPAKQREETLSLDGCQLFDPMDGRPMKEWVQVPFDYKEKWKELMKSSVNSLPQLLKRNQVLPALNQKRPLSRSPELSPGQRQKRKRNQDSLMSQTIIQKIVFKNTTCKELYSLYMDSKKHTISTRDTAKIGTKEGDRFSVHGGYATGKNLRLIKDRLIAQTWRAADWKKSDADSIFVLTFTPLGNDVRVEMTQANVPDEQIALLREAGMNFTGNAGRNF